MSKKQTAWSAGRSGTSLMTKKDMWFVHGPEIVMDYEGWGFTEDTAKRIAKLPDRERRIADLETTVEKLKGELAAAERDAGRLDWLAGQGDCGMVKFATGGYALNWDNRCTDRLDTLREAIDAAIQDKDNHPGSIEPDSTEGVK